MIDSGLHYTGMVSDGDSNAYRSTVAAQPPYGADKNVVKEECVNHVAKRLGTALAKVAKNHALGGKNNLSESVRMQLQSYYKNAIVENPGDEGGNYGCSVSCY